MLPLTGDGCGGGIDNIQSSRQPHLTVCISGDERIVALVFGECVGDDQSTHARLHVVFVFERRAIGEFSAVVFPYNCQGFAAYIGCVYKSKLACAHY
jgi:hypothetical protein